MKDRRVVITGLGALSPLGLDVKSSWEGALAGHSGIRRIEEFDPTDFSAQIAGPIAEGFEPEAFMPKKDVKKFDSFIQYAIAASSEAVKDSGLVDIDDAMGDRIGVAIGAGIGGLPLISKNNEALLNGGPRKISPFFIPGAIINLASGYVSMQYNFRGPNVAFATACATGAHSIGYAARMIAYGEADAMLTGGVEKSSSPIGIGGFAAMRALSKRNDEPQKASRPWDKDRDGFVLSDGAGILMLEEYEHAKSRGAHIYAELVGFGATADAYHITAPSGEGGKRAMLTALKDAGVEPSAVQYVNAHATSTPAGDEVELHGIEEVFADSIGSKFAVSGTKSMTGHMLGAAGALEAIFSILAIRDQVVPPTINLDNPSVETKVNLVPHEAQQLAIKYTLSNSFGFGGTNAALLFAGLS